MRKTPGRHRARTQIWEQPLQRSSESSQEHVGGTRRGRGGHGSTMPQCSPSARPPNRAQWLHCQQAVSCTFIGLPDTRPLSFFNNQHNNLFTGRGNGLLLDRRAERDHSALNGRWLRLFFCLCHFFHSTTNMLWENGRLSPFCCSPALGAFSRC